MVKRDKAAIWLIMLVATLIFTSTTFAARIKDIAAIGGVRDNQLIGYGIVVGLAGTGDDLTKNLFTTESLVNMMSRQGLYMKDKYSTMKADNVAAVMVTAALPPFAKIGTKIDVVVSSLGSAKSLSGGTLLLTPLRGVDGEVYAVAQGPVTLGGFSARGTGGGVAKNHTTAGNISNGAFVEKELKYDFDQKRTFVVNLQHPDFTTASRMAATINKMVSFVEARQIDSFSVAVRARDSFRGSLSELVYFIESLDVPVDSAAVVMLNEKTGTVVMGDNVRISTVAIAHGNLSIQIREDAKVSQPLPFAPAAPAGSTSPARGPGSTAIAPGGQTVVIPQTIVSATEDKKYLMTVPQGVTIYDVVRALNALGVSPRDLITILQSIKAAGALQADLKNNLKQLVDGMDAIKLNTAVTGGGNNITEATFRQRQAELQKIKKACQDFESIFTYYLLKTMRQTVPKNSGFGSLSGKDTYNMIMDQKIAEDLSRRGNGLGLQKVLFEQLTKNYLKEGPQGEIK